MMRDAEIEQILVGGQCRERRQQRQRQKDQRRQRHADEPCAARTGPCLRGDQDGADHLSVPLPETGRPAAHRAPPPSARRSASRRSPGPPCAPARGPSPGAECRSKTSGRACRRGRSSSAAMKAPRIEPMPPMTMTTKARMRMLSPMPGSTEMIGAIMMPANAGEHGAEAEHDHEQPLDIDAERRDHRGRWSRPRAPACRCA